MEDQRAEGVTSPTGWVTLTCRNHPTLRWVMKDPRTAHNRISNNPMLMFRGDNTDRMMWPPEARVNEEDKDHEKWAYECACSFDDLIIRGNSGSNQS